MNFLAHLYLSRSDEEWMVGNFIADNVKGAPADQFPGKIIEGIHMHRAIDSFSSKHEMVQRSVHRLIPNYRKYAWVIVDIFYDHYLAANWQEFSDQPLPDFSKKIYQLLEKNMQFLPHRSERFFYYMKMNDLLTEYANLSGIQMALNGMARRASFQSNMEKAVKDLKEDYNLFEKDFRGFFPDLEKFVNESYR